MIGPQVSKAQLEKIESYVKIGLDEGAELLCGGERYVPDGFSLEGLENVHFTAGASHRAPPERRSASADAAALRWTENHPDDDFELPPAPAARGQSVTEPANGGPRHRSASAEAAALRWSERHPDHA
jgi:Aldehyde dehydrogenase family